MEEDDTDHNTAENYCNNPSIMKRHKYKYKNMDDCARLDHPQLNNRVTPNQFKGTDLSKIRNVSPGR